jgi:hypothetical protein
MYLGLNKKSGRKGRVYAKVEGCSFFNIVLLTCPIWLPIFSLLSNEPKLGTELDSGMVMTLFPSSILGQESNLQPYDGEPNSITLDRTDSIKLFFIRNSVS